ncbi:MAG: sulfite exporter TauE/SafE family protein [Acidimicrobiia bacterium]
MSAGELVAVVAIVFLAASVQTTTGFGFSLTAVPLMALAVDTRTASMLAAVLSLTTSATQAWQGRADIVWPLAKRLCTAAAIGMPVGLLMFARADDRLLRVFLGITTLVLVALLVHGIDLSRAGRSIDWVAGSVAGVLTTSLSTNGPPLVFVLQGRRLSPAQFRATVTTIFSLTGIVGVGGRVAVGGLTRDVVVACALAPLPLLAGMAIGFRLRRRLDPERFRRAVMALLVLAALSAIAAGLRG